jgi:hypothetical protein
VLTIKNCDCDFSYLQSSKNVALKPKHAKLGIPTNEIIGETIINGNKKPRHIIIDTGSSSSILLKKFIDKKLLVKNSRTATEWTDYLRWKIIY